jgi:hypothetical protein
MEDRKRSRSNPGVDLEECVALSRKVQQELGFGDHTRLAISQALGSNGITGSTARKIAAMAAFGLLRKAGEGYSLTGLFRKLLRPLPGEEPKILKECFMTVPLYQELLERYRPDGFIPASLPAILERHYEIVHPAGNQAAKVFLSSAIYAGLLLPDATFAESSTAEPIESSEAAVVPDSEDLRNPPISVGARIMKPNESPLSVATPTALGTASVGLTSPFVNFSTANSLTKKEKDRIVLWIDKVLKPWIEFQVQDLEEEQDA